MASELKWHGDDAFEELEAALQKGLVAAGMVLMQAIHDELDNNIGPPRSSPGELPRLESPDSPLPVFRLEFDSVRKSVLVVSDVNYSLYLELGTQKMHARPFVSTAIATSMQAMSSAAINASDLTQFTSAF